MRDSALTLGNYRPEDFHALARLVAEERLEGKGSYSTLGQDVIEGLGRPNHAPEHDLFVAREAGDIVGSIDVTKELTIGRVVLTCLVFSERRGEIVARELLEKGIIRARELGVGRVHINIPEASVMVLELLEKMGFRCVRHFLDLRLGASEAPSAKRGMTFPRCRHMKKGEEDKLVHIQNRSFADTWGFKPNTLEEIVYRIALPNCSPEDVIFACDAETVIGYCWARIYSGERKEAGERRGSIQMLGVVPANRGKGIGKEVLMAGLSYLRRRGARAVDLTVDAENKAALALYRSAGFHVRMRSLWYERKLN
jgi:mycothiol synthase